jgi:dihydroorotase
MNPWDHRKKPSAGWKAWSDMDDCRISRIDNARLCHAEEPGSRMVDIILQDGRIASIEPSGALRRSTGPVSPSVLDAGGRYVVPGLIDIHAHVVPGLIPLCVEPDTAGVKSGACTVCDAGSVGWENLEAGIRAVTDAGGRTDTCFFVHLAPEGEKVLPETGYARFDRPMAREILRRHRDRVVGIKIRAVEAALLEPSMDVLATAADLAHQAGLPLMVHVGDRNPSVRGAEAMYRDTTCLLGLLERGDILTHCYTPFPGGLFREGTPVPGLDEALARGVLLDAAPGRGQFSLPIAKRAIANGYVPHLAGTDTVKQSRPMPHYYNLAAILSKLMASGLGLDQTLRLCTVNAARAIHRETSLGSIAPGRQADLTILERERGLFFLTDGGPAHVALATTLLRPRAVIKNGQSCPLDPAIEAHRAGLGDLTREVRELLAARRAARKAAGAPAQAAENKPSAPRRAG